MAQTAATDLTIVMPLAILARAMMGGEHTGMYSMRLGAQLSGMAGMVGNHAEHDKHR